MLFKIRSSKFCRASARVPSRWKVLSGEFRRRPTALVKKFASRIVSVAEDCLSPERTFHGCPQITPLDASACRFGAFMLFKFRGAVLQFKFRRSKFCRASACVSSRWKVLSGEFRRRPTELVKKFRKPDRVGRRGLFEPREDFSRLTTYVFPRLDSEARISG